MEVFLVQLVTMAGRSMLSKETALLQVALPSDAFARAHNPVRKLTQLTDGLLLIKYNTLPLFFANYWLLECSRHGLSKKGKQSSLKNLRISELITDLYILCCGLSDELVS
jgi:hypothetical protein